jgi:eukaryotic-like serine/threonine-protein kinase
MAGRSHDRLPEEALRLERLGLVCASAARTNRVGAESRKCARVRVHLPIVARSPTDYDFIRLLSPGDQLKGYEVVATLTEGGMATLVMARRRHAEGRGALVALKVVHEHLTDDSGMIRLFLDEARVTGRVKHPNVVHVEEVGIHRGAYFLVMEYVHGVSLASLLRRLEMERRRMSPRLAVYLAAQLAEALHAAHEATDGRGRPLNVVHRDVSPQNVLISHVGQVKLIDFGIASSTQSHTGVLGKLCYMAPEQVGLTEVDRRTDVYSLGIVLWEALTGRTLFRSKNFDDYRDAAIRTRIAAPSRYAGDVTPALDEAVLRALAADPDERWETAFAFRRALLAALPEAVTVDAQLLSSLVHGYAEEELSLLRARLPQDIIATLDSQRIVDPAIDDAKIAASLTIEQSERAQSLNPPDENEPTRNQPIALRFRSLSPDELLPTESERELRKRFIGWMGGVAAGFLLLGIAIGRASAPARGAAEPVGEVSARGAHATAPLTEQAALRDSETAGPRPAASNIAGAGAAPTKFTPDESPEARPARAANEKRGDGTRTKAKKRRRPR